MKTNKELLAIAKKQIGNTGAKYRNYVHAGGSWCDMFVFWLYDANGCGTLLPWKGTQRTYCPASIKWCQKNLAQIPPYLAMACDIIYFDWEKNGTPNHIGVVEKRGNSKSIQTIEGNTSGGKVDDKSRNMEYVQAIFRPKFKDTVKLCKLETETGDFAYVSIANFRRALGLTPSTVLDKETVKAWQKKIGFTGKNIDGAWGNATSKKSQEYLKKQGFYNGAIDSKFEKASTIALKKWINHVNGAEIKPVEKPVETKPVEKPTETAPVEKPKQTNAEKLVATARELAWPKGTKSSKYDFKKKGSRPTTQMIAAMKKRGYTNREDQSDCGYDLNTVIYKALGIKTKVLGAVHESFPDVEGFEIAWQGKKIPKGLLKAGMMVRYKKKKKKKIRSQHAFMYMGNNDIAEGGRGIRFFVIKHFKYFTTAKFNKKNVAFETLQVLRAKE